MVKESERKKYVPFQELLRRVLFVAEFVDPKLMVIQKNMGIGKLRSQS
jgi:hypothetical protein